MVDNNPMLRDGITGDWWVMFYEGFNGGLHEADKTIAGLELSSVTRVLSGRQDFRTTQL